MSFATAPSVTRAMHERIDHPFFGYYFESDAYYQAIIDWRRSRKGVTDLAAENIGYENGVLGGVISALNVLCSKGDNVLLADCRAWCDEHGVSYADFPRFGWDVGVSWHDGRLFECPGCVRLAVSVPHSQVIEAFDRLDRYVFC